MPGFKLLRYQKGFNIYENENYIPYGFSYDIYMTEQNLSSYSEVDKAKMMLKAILLDDEQVAKYGYMFQSFDNYYNSGKHSVDLSNKAMSSDCAARRNTSAVSFDTVKNGFEAIASKPFLFLYYEL